MEITFNWSSASIAAHNNHTSDNCRVPDAWRITIIFCCAMHKSLPYSAVGLVCDRGHVKDRRNERRRFLVGPADRASSSTWLTFRSCCSRADYYFESCNERQVWWVRIHSRAAVEWRNTRLRRLDQRSVGRIKSTAVSVKGTPDWQRPQVPLIFFLFNQKLFDTPEMIFWARRDTFHSAIKPFKFIHPDINFHDNFIYTLVLIRYD